MANVKTSILQLVGKTPLLEIINYEAIHQLKAKIIVKLEYLNPAGSIKDRIALAMVEDAEKRGILKPGATLIEPTSGNTGIGIAAVAAAKRYQAVLVMPETMGVERRKLLQVYGAKLVLTDGYKGMQGAIEKAHELNREIEGSFILSQFTNPANPEIHWKTTGMEIWEDLEGQVDIFVAGVGSGGTITGVGEYLKSRNPKIQVVAVEPASAPVLSKGVVGMHRIQGLGAGFIPKILNTSIYSEIIAVEDNIAFAVARELAMVEGVLAGVSSGAALWAATQMAERPENRGKTIVTILPDTGERYISTPLFEL